MSESRHLNRWGLSGGRMSVHYLIGEMLLASQTKRARVARAA